jgi:hypothetical protein
VFAPLKVSGPNFVAVEWAGMESYVQPPAVVRLIGWRNVMKYRSVVVIEIAARAASRHQNDCPRTRLQRIVKEESGC